MKKGFIIFISDDNETIVNMQAHAYQNSINIQAYRVAEWKSRLNDPQFSSHLRDLAPPLTIGQGLQPRDGLAKVLPFPSQDREQRVEANFPSHSVNSNVEIKTMNEIEAMTIKKAIHQCHGNLTETAKALGIGRATLYRKVKQYNINPAEARQKKAA